MLASSSTEKCRERDSLLFYCYSVGLLLQVEAKMAELKRQYDEKLQQKEELRKKSDFMEMMLDRASQLVSGLIGEKERWENTVTVRTVNICHSFPSHCHHRL